MKRELFEELCLPHHQALLGHAQKLTRSRDDALDLVQTTMMKALRSWEDFDPPAGSDPAAKTKSWLHSICMNAYIEVHCRRAGFRRRRCTEQREEVMRGTYGTTEDGRDPRRLDDGIGDEVTHALAVLDPDQRDVIERCDFRGEKYLDIARDLRVPIGTVMSKLHRARRRLGEELAEYAEREYGIRRPVIVLRGAGKDALPVHAPAAPEPEADRVDRIVAQDDPRDLGGGEPAPDALAAW